MRGVGLGNPWFDDDHCRQKIELLAQQRVAVVSFTFSCLTRSVVQRFQRAGTSVWATVTDPQEASLAAAVGADALVVQGVEAGGHRGSFVDADDHEDCGILALLGLVARRVDLPLVAAGGIATGPGRGGRPRRRRHSSCDRHRLPSAVPKAGTTTPRRDAIRQPRTAGLTRALIGRLARGLVNTFQADHTAATPIAYPELHHLTAPLRARARENGDAEQINLWAGQAHELAEATRPASWYSSWPRRRAAALSRASHRLK